MNPPALTILIVAHNEEREIAACLDTCRFADQIVVVLDRCTDGTKEIALRYGAVLVEGGWPNEGQRRMAGIEASAGPWILEIDCDERVPPALAAEIRAVLPGAPPGLFTIPFHNYVGKRLVRHGWGAYNGVGAKNCLFHKGNKLWGEDLVHPKVTLIGPRIRLANAIDHYVDDDLDDMYARLNRYTTLAARQAVMQNTVAGRYDTVRRIFGRFFKSYVSRKGYKEGIYGVALAVFSALYPLLTYLKARALIEEGRNRDS
jgi:glycosyltransferase involved in cell wall biosynthesis